MFFFPDAVTYTKENFFSQYFYAIVNMCTASGLGKREIADVVNTVLLDQKTENDEEPVINGEEISTRSQEDNPK